MTYKQLITDLLQKIAAHTGDALSREQAINEGKESFLEIDHNDTYGGYRVHSVDVDGGTCRAALGYNETSPRISAKKMVERLGDILRGIELVKPAQ
jgi:hypothetical protein